MARAATVLLVAAVAVGVGAHLLAPPGPAARAVVSRYVRAWSHHDYAAMWELLSPASQRRIGSAQFATALADAARTATATALEPRKLVAISGSVARERFVVSTTMFGTLHEVAALPLTGGGAATRIVFGPSILFPGLGPNQALTRRSTLAPRGSLLAANGQVLAQGSALTSPIPAVAGAIVGALEPPPAGQAAQFAAAGYPPHARVGVSGLEQVFQAPLAGRPGGVLRAGARVLARARPQAGVDVRTSIEPTLESDTVAVLAGRYGGITVMDPRTGAVEAAAGIAWGDIQPPGSTFKIITASAALTAGITSPSTVYPVHSSIVIDGFRLHNAAGERCGGTLLNAFAVSCDTTFAPLGVALGAPRLVAMARRYGFDRPTGIPGVTRSVIPTATQIGDAVAVGASAIGQGRVQATTLEMADAAAAIADGGLRPLPTMRYGAAPRYERVVSPKVAGEVQSMMEAVVSYGTGTSAQIPGVTVAGKTGTAELRDTAGRANAFKYTDSWFVAYAPVGDPKVVVCALFPGQGYGAQTAAPAVKALIEDALAQPASTGSSG